MSGVAQMLLGSVGGTPVGQSLLLPYTTSFIVPPRVTSISAVIVACGYGNYGAAGGGGAGLAYGTIAVTPGETLTLTGIDTYGTNDAKLKRGTTELLVSYKGTTTGGGYYVNTSYVTSYGGGNGGNAGSQSSGWQGAGAGGAGGYTGDGGNGGDSGTAYGYGTSGSNGSGGGGGGGGGSGGYSYFIDSSACGDTQLQIYNYRGGPSGGVGLYGQGTSGTGGAGTVNYDGYGGTNGSPDSTGYGFGRSFGADGNRQYITDYPDCSIYDAAYNYQDYYNLIAGCRIIWGPNRAYPSTNTADV